MNPDLLQWLVPVATVAAAWGGTRQALNGTRERVKDIDRKLDDHVAWEAEKYSGLTERIVAVEVKVEQYKK
jgi:hypothetical protein